MFHSNNAQKLNSEKKKLNPLGCPEKIKPITLINGGKGYHERRKTRENEEPGEVGRVVARATE